MAREIGFIGLGSMGKPMAMNLVNKGHAIIVYDIRPEPVDELAAIGATPARSSREVAEKAEVIITMLPSSPHVEAAILGQNGVMEGVRPGSIVVDMSTIDPATTRRVGEAL